MNDKEKGNLYLKVLGLIFISFIVLILGEILKSGERLTYNEVKIILLSFLIMANVLGVISIFINKKNKNL